MRKLLLLAVILGARALSYAQAPMNGLVRIPSGVFASATTKKVQPKYPEQARRAHVQGSVTMRALIGLDGRIQALEPVSGPGMLTDAAMEAVRQWTYAPYLVEGLPRTVSTLITVNFSFARPASPDQESAVSVGPQIMAGLLRKYVDPTLAADISTHAIVRLSLIIDRLGSVKAITAEEGPVDLSAAAERAVSQWQYAPFLVEGVPAEVKTTVAFDF